MPTPARSVYELNQSDPTTMASYLKRLRLDVQKHIFRDGHEEESDDEEESPDDQPLSKVKHKPTVPKPLHQTDFVTHHISPAKHDDNTIGNFASQNTSLDRTSSPNYSTEDVTDSHTIENHSNSTTGRYSAEHYATDNYTANSDSADDTTDSSITGDYSMQRYSTDIHNAIDGYSTDSTTHSYSTDNHTTNSHYTNTTINYHNGSDIIQNYPVSDYTVDGYTIDNFTTDDITTKNPTAVNYEPEETYTSDNNSYDDYITPNNTDSYVADNLTSYDYVTPNYTDSSYTTSNRTTYNENYTTSGYITPKYTTASNIAADYIADIITKHRYKFITRTAYGAETASFKYATDSYTSSFYTTENHLSGIYAVDNYTVVRCSTTFLPSLDIMASPVIRYLAAVVLIGSCLLGIFGHCATILAVARTKNIGGSLQGGGSLARGVARDGGTRLLLTNACFTGLIGCLVNLPMNTANVIAGRLVSSRQLCAAVGFINVLMSSALQASSSAIAVQQCQILLTRSRGRYSRTQATLVVVLSWAVPAALAACASPVVGFNSQLLSCVLEPQREQLPWMPVLVVSVPTWTALVVVATSYALIYRAANHRARSVAAQTVAKVRAMSAVVELTRTGRGHTDGRYWRSGKRCETRGAECAGEVEKMDEREVECDDRKEENLEYEEGKGKRWRSGEIDNCRESDDKKENGVSDLGNDPASSMPQTPTLKVFPFDGESSDVRIHSSPTEARKKVRVSTIRDKRLGLALKMTINWTICAVMWGPLSVMFLVDSFEPVPADALLIGSMLSRIFCGFGWIVHGIWNERLRRTLRYMLSCQPEDSGDHISPSPFRRQKNRVTPLRVPMT